METHPVVVIGAGPAGLGAAGALKHRGVRSVVLEASPHVGNSWRNHYDRLHLHTARPWSGLPGFPIPKRYGMWVAKDDLVSYFEEYVRWNDLDVRLGVEVEKIRHFGDGWRVDTNEGTFAGDSVVMATGYNRRPADITWAGADEFEGDLVHSAHYKNPEPYRGKDVLVVGSGNSGAEIVVDLVEGGAERVRISIRRPPTVLLRDVNGFPSQAVGIILRKLPTATVDKIWPFVQKNQVGDLTKYGIPNPEPGAYSRFLADDVVPILDVGFVKLLKEGKVEVVSAVHSLAGRDVILSDGTRIQPDAVIAGVGFKRALEPMVGHLGILEDGPRGRPLVQGDEDHPNAPGMYFLGFRNPVSGMLREIGIDARRIAAKIQSESRIPA